MKRLILEIYDVINDSWSRIEEGNWKNRKELELHIERIRNENINLFVTTKKESNIPPEYKYTIENFHQRYKSCEERNLAARRIFGEPVECFCPIIIL